MKIPLFFNNTARSARAGRFRRWLDRHRDFFDVIEPESREDMLNHLVSQANSGAPAVAVAGGDGTLGIAARALCNTETVLAPFPAGTMNVFSREIGIRPDFDHALHILNTGRFKNVDLFAFNGQVFLQMAGIGGRPRRRTDHVGNEKKMESLRLRNCRRPGLYGKTAAPHPDHR